MDEEKGFQIRDRRSSTQESPPQVPPSETSDEPRSAEATRPEPSSSRFEGDLPPITFTSFILSLATSGLTQLGYAVHPESGKASVDLAMARQTIDLLALLEEKTKGNRTPEEDAQLSQILFNLRMTFVEVEKKR